MQWINTSRAGHLDNWDDPAFVCPLTPRDVEDLAATNIHSSPGGKTCMGLNNG